MLKVCADAEELAREAARFIAAAGIGAVYSTGRFDLVLAGGRTPLGAYRELVAGFGHQMRLWRRVHLWWGDERCAPPRDPDSNFHAAGLALILPLGVSRSRVHRIEAEARDPERVAREYGRAFPERPDLLVLGVGEDGHTAALFPHSPALEEGEERFVYVKDSPKPPPRRITLTPAGIRSARRTLVLAAGASKASAVERALAAEGSAAETPARLARDALWMVDREAAAKVV